MRYLIYGGSGSGKSSFAENIVTNIDSKTKIYLATMQVYDEEGRKKVKRHQDIRKDKGFSTVEAPNDFDKHDELTGEYIGDSTVLLECMSNLVANEMFGGEQDLSGQPDLVSEKVLKDIESMAKNVEELVIVTNNVAEDGIEYDDSTMAYIKALSDVNVGLTSIADVVTEVVVGIPVPIKERN